MRYSLGQKAQGLNPDKVIATSQIFVPEPKPLPIPGSEPETPVLELDEPEVVTSSQTYQAPLAEVPVQDAALMIEPNSDADQFFNGLRKWNLADITQDRDGTMHFQMLRGGWITLGVVGGFLLWNKFRGPKARPTRRRRTTRKPKTGRIA